jgi:hypothetical protein
MYIRSLSNGEYEMYLLKVCSYGSDTLVVQHKIWSHDTNYTNCFNFGRTTQIWLHDTKFVFRVHTQTLNLQGPTTPQGPG